MAVITCPSCGLATEHPHDTQQACIEALHQEIARVRGILALLKEPGASRETDAGDESEEDEEPLAPGAPIDVTEYKAKGAAPAC